MKNSFTLSFAFIALIMNVFFYIVIIFFYYGTV